MHQGLFVRDIQSNIITRLAEASEADSRAALKAASRVGPFHKEAMTKLFALLRVNVLEDAIALLYKACNVGKYVQTVHIGSKERADQVDPRKLEELVALLPNARRIVLHPVAIVAPFVLPILSREYAFQSYVLVVSNRPQSLLRDVMPTIDASGNAAVFTTNTRLALPADGTWSPEVTPESVEYLYTQGIGGKHGMEAHLQHVRAIIPADAAVTVAFYPSTVMAAANFGRFLQTNGEKLTGIQILWTSAEGQLHIRPQSYSRARHRRLYETRINHHRSVRGFERDVHVRGADVLPPRTRPGCAPQDASYQELAQLNWSAVTNALAPATAENPNFLGIRFTVLGCSDFVAMDVGTVLYEQLTAGQRIPIQVQSYGIPLLTRFCSSRSASTSLFRPFYLLHLLLHIVPNIHASIPDHSPHTRKASYFGSCHVRFALIAHCPITIHIIQTSNLCVNATAESGDSRNNE